MTIALTGMGSNEMARVGIEIEVESSEVDTPSIAQAIAEGQLTGWELDLNEHSLRGGSFGWEIKTSGRGIEMDTVWSALSQLYPIVRGSTGSWRAAVHTHVDIIELTYPQRALVLGLGYALDRSIFALVSPERTESNFCVPLDHKPNEVLSAIRAMAQLSQPRPYGKYSSININPMSELGTFEFRHMKTPASGTTVSSVTSMLQDIYKFVVAANEVISVASYVNPPQTTVEAAASFFALASNKFLWDRVGLRVDPEAALAVAIALSEAERLEQLYEGNTENSIAARIRTRLLVPETSYADFMSRRALEIQEHDAEEEEFDAWPVDEEEEEWDSGEVDEMGREVREREREEVGDI